ncbi:MAG: tRNA 2-thiouridine(34) synthase MnmA [Oligoflexia bacterium]|nr:tRNA 2-thiouridine(34) synthase MnmA [Oligoflexia bacterium]
MNDLPLPPSSHTPAPGATVVVGMSGGVDSSVAALVLKHQGYRVIGMFMKNWEETDDSGVCQAARDYDDVARVCERLEIPYYGVEFVREYWDNVFTRFLEEYRAGFTPNPDILCNREIKFNAFLEKALSLGADFLATGHYCQNWRVGGHHQLVKGVDPGKDQTYFLHTLDESILSKVLFPIGHIEKPRVRELAREAGLPTHSKKDSTGICFIGERNFRPFLAKYIPGKPGEMRTLDGEVVGRHTGSAYYTLGQRKGLGLGGEGEPWFVVGKDPARNVLWVARGERHPALYADWLEAAETSWVSKAAPGSLPFRCRAKIRYRQPDQDCTITRIEGDRLRVEFDQPQRAIAPGQSVVFYNGDVCLGGAVIRLAGPSYFEQGRELPPREA